MYRLISDTEGRSGLDQVEMPAKAILTVIAEAEFESRKLRITDIIRLRRFGTSPTVYNKLDRLEHDGWIRYEPDPDDARAKIVRLTTDARRAFDAMSDDMYNVLKAVCKRYAASKGRMA